MKAHNTRSPARREAGSDGSHHVFVQLSDNCCDEFTILHVFSARYE